MTDSASPQLAPPGAGVPVWQVVPVRLTLPVLPLLIPPRKALAKADAVGRTLVEQVEGLGDRAGERVLIKPMPFLEDSSRNWSAAMVLEHLAIVGGVVAGVIETLTGGESIPSLLGTADVKPTGTLTPADAIGQFREMDGAYQAASRALIDAMRLAKPRAKAPHPWFGRLDARQWCAFEAIHRKVHLGQVRAIAGGIV